MMRVGLASALLLASIAGCSEPTQLLLVVDSDLEPGVEIAAVTVTASAEGGAADTARFDLSEVSLPLSLGISPTREADETLRISVHALDPDGRAVVSYSVVTHFVAGEIRRLEVPLARACVGAECGGGDQVCQAGECVDPTVDPASLPRGAGSDPPEPLFEGPHVAPDAGIADGGACVPDAPCDLGECARGVLRCEDAEPVCALDEAVAAGTPCEGDGVCNGAGRCER